MAKDDIVVSIGGDDSKFRAVWNKLNSDIKSSGVGNLGSQFSTASKGINEYTNATRSANDSTRNLAESQLPRLRYALYDIAAVSQNVANSIFSMNNAVLSTAMDYETAFTQVERTSGATGEQLNVLREDLLRLSTQVPLAFGQITQIASLGAQMGIASQDLKAFTQTVTQFASISNASVDSTAQSFGALSQLLNVSSADFDKLGSAVAYAGIQSNATETEILSVATQIGGVANQAGLSAQHVIGLSTALAGLRIPAEQSRGALTRVFQEINTAATSSGPAMQRFADILGVSREQAQNLATTDMGSFFNKFIFGLSNLNPQQLTDALAALDLNELRVTNTLTRLADNTDVVAKSFTNVSTAYEGGTFLAESFAKKQDDLASLLVVLDNVVKELAANIGGPLLAAMKPLVATVAAILAWFNEIAKNPIVQVFGVIVGSVITLGGALLAVVAHIALTVGAMAAFATAGAAMNKIGITGPISMGKYALSIFGVKFASDSATTSIAATGAMSEATAKRIRIATMSTLAFAAVAVALWGVVTVWNAIADSMRSAEDRAKDYYGTSTAIIDAARQDTAELAAGVQTLGDKWGSIDLKPIELTADQKAAKALDEAAGAAADATGSIDALNGSNKNLDSTLTDVTTSIDDQTLALGKNAKAAALKIIQDKIMSDSGNPLTKIFNDPELSAALKKSGFDVAEFTNNILANTDKSNAAAQAQLDSLKKSVSGHIAARGAAGQYKGAIEDILPLLGEYRDNTVGLVGAEVAAVSATNAVAGAAANAGDEFNGFSLTVDNLHEKFQTAFGNPELFGGMNDAIDNLNNGLESNGIAFDTMTSGGIANLANLEAALEATIKFAEAMGMDASTGVAIVFSQLAAKGVETAQILAQLKSMGADTSSIEVALGGQYAGFTDAFNAMNKAATGAGKSVDSVAQKVVTLKDYANDLSSVWTRAFEIRFDSQSALDNITKSFRDIAKATADAKSEIDALNADISGLTSDKALQEYYLSIANAYGDTIAAAKAQANLNKINASLTSKTESLAEAQASSNKTLIGNSDAAIENRATIRGLVSNYQTYIQSLAASGASQEELAAATAQAKIDFMAQATQLGYNSTELGTYAAAFDDVSTAIGNVPRNITVTASTDPAIQALNELNAKANTAAANRNMSISASVDFSAIQKFGRGAALITELNGIEARIQRIIANPGSADSKERQIASANARAQEIKDALNSGSFASGGYTGPGGKYDIAGVVHKGEYVIPKEQVNQITGLPYFMSQIPKFFTGISNNQAQQTPSSMMVELSPTDRALLAQAGNVQLSIDGRIIAGATNQNNLVSAQRGAN